VRHSLGLEAALVVTLYGVYELARGLVVGNRQGSPPSRRPACCARAVAASLRRRGGAASADVLPGLTDLLGVAYLTLHVAVTAVVLLWLPERRPTAVPFVRTTLLVASALALVGFIAYPTAPPRLAGIGIADTVSNGHATSTTGWSAPSTTRTRPFRACTSATR
jgi:cytochrome bd-type quinol oxidase subunit 2